MLTKDILRKRSFLCLIVLMGVGQVMPSHAQVRGGERGSALATPAPENPLSQLRARLSSATVPLPLEGAVDPEVYVVGPGDLFDVSVGGAEPVVATLPVSADGRLVLPNAGSVTVAGLSLAEARSRVLEALRAQFQRVQVDVALAQPRQFYVHVSGAVPVPGRHLATPVARVAGVLEMAFADSTQPAVANPAYRPSLRNVTLLRRGGERISLDLLRYFATGDTDHNPYLNDGDVLSVPPYDPDHESVFVDGAVAFPGAYAYRPGDTVLDLLALATGNELPGTARQVRLTRQQANGTVDVISLDIAELHAEGGTAVPVRPLDHVFVLPDETIRGTASVTGWVPYPGTYPIEPGKTTLRELIDMAGGLRPQALLQGAYLERRMLPEPEVRLNRQSRLEGRFARPEVLRADSVALLQQMRLAGLDYMSRAYFAQELRLQNRVSLDLAGVLAGEAAPVHLQDGDRLVVPRDEGTIFVFGQVTRPGYVEFEPGRSAEAYITAVGGRSALAAEAYVVKAGTGQYLPARSAVVESGDMIFLDRQEDIADSAELQRLVLSERQARADARLRTAQLAIQVVGTVATIVTTYLFLNARQ